ncbi:lipase class 2 [Catenulispora acidiphila DSM 44928]|uniref:Lipase class 2 n=1 Tax=Catenulispora acidiphila (strain DSM 44928 / JCM 14897 / NBRC 102108 / NRRL B-24433 / ID139908) TaxID=479433 RepID=C7QF38_CATAD|nr:alpha/beta fold hydrolase [Catenulispora acidiphila]ACU74796.1 lipase class 2 [Catenulispora acidiphila DSM 44928]
MRKRRILHALSALLLVAPLVALAAPAQAATSSGINDFSCKPSAAHPRPVVLVHGTFGNASDNWLVGAPYIAARGYCVFELDYGQEPGIPLFHGLAPVAQSAQQLSDYVNQVLGATGASQVDIVGHSQGGMMPRYYLKFLGDAAKVHTLVGLAPSNHGTNLDDIETLAADYFPAALGLIGTACPSCSDQIVGSPLMQQLNAGGDTVPGVQYTVISTLFDEVVTPWQSQRLSGANVHNILLQNLCPTDLSEHVLIGTTDKIALHEAVNALDPSHATPTTCLSAFS